MSSQNLASSEDQKKTSIEAERASTEQEQHRVVEHLALLNETAADLLTGSDPIERLYEFFQKFSDRLGLEIFVQYNVSSDGTHLELNSWTGFPEKYYRLLKRLEFGQAVCGTVAQTRRPMYVNHVQASTDRKTKLIRTIGIDTYACHPLIANGRLLGTLSFGSRRLSQFDEQTIHLLRAFCQMVATALERKQADEALRQSEARQAYLLQISDVLRPLSDAVMIQEAVSRTAMEYFKADRCYYCEIEENNSIIQQDASRHGLPSVVGVYSLTTLPILKAVVDLGRPFVVEDAHTSALLDESLRQLCIELRVIAFIDVPVIKNGLPVGIFCITQVTPRVWTEFEVGLAVETAERTWAAVERARTEKALRLSEERFRSSIENLTEAFVIYSAVRRDGKIIDFRYEYVNEEACRLHQLAREQLVGHTLLEIIPMVKETGMFSRYTQVVETGQPLKGHQYISSYAEGRSQADGVFDYRVSKFGDGIIITANDVTEQVRLEAEHQKAVQAREIHHRLTEQREIERQSYARDIHDGPIQTLSSLTFNLQYLKETYTDPTLRVELDQIGLSIKCAVQELRQVMNELRPPSVIRFGLAKAIQVHAENLRERYPLIAWNLKLADDRQVLPEQTCLALFRIYQEAVNNIIRHSEASKAWIYFRVMKEQIILEIRDNGKGFTENQDISKLTNHQHFGLAGISERVEAMNGELEIISQPGKGTTLKVRVPTP